ncbi:MAG: helix-turn-helix domain-containing protein [Bosea sp. (in: a-proteobacteria)]
MQHVFAIGQREARQRLGWFLASFSPGARELDLPLSRQDIADYLGLTIETVSREFMRLKRMGSIAYGRSGSITILRPDQLQG